MRIMFKAPLAPLQMFLSILVLGSLPLGIIGCHSSDFHPTAGSEAQPAASSETQPAAQSAVKTFHLEGTVVSIDHQQKRIVVDHKEIPGFMGAMTMPYPVADGQTLDRVKPGDRITADVVASSSDVHLDNVVVAKKSDAHK